MRWTVGLALSLTLAAGFAGLSSTPLSAAQATQTGCSSIAGTAQDVSGAVVANRTVRLRDVNGTVVQVTASGADGSFKMGGVAPGTYVVEVLNADGSVGGTSTVQVLPTCEPITNVILTAMGAAGAALAGGAGGAGFFTTTAGIVLAGALAAGVVIAVVVAKNEASGSR